MAKRSAEEQRKLVAMYRDRGAMTRSAFCEQHQLNPSTLDFWVRKFRHARPSGRLVAVKLQQAGALSGSFSLMLANGRRIETNWQFSESDLVRLIRIAESA